MKIKSVELPKTFIPEFNGNRELPKAEQIVVHIKEHVSNVQLAQYKKFKYKDGATIVEYDDISIMAYHVGNIDNLEDGNGKIDTGATLADSKNKMLYPLMTETRRWLLDASEPLEPGESKPSD